MLRHFPEDLPTDSLLCSVAYDSVTPHTVACASLSVDFPGKHTGVGCHFLLQEIFPTQGSNPRLLHWQDSLLLSQQGNPKDSLVAAKPQDWAS